MNQQSSSFGIYESFRILLPGFYFATLLFFFYWAIAGVNLGMGFGGFPLFILYCFIALVSGLTMYAKETPKRRKAFLQNQPSAHLQQKARILSETEPLSDQDARHLYFYLLNSHVPSTFHDKIFFFGTIYHIMILIRRMSFWFALFGTMAGGVRLAMGFTIADQRDLLAITLVVWSLYLMNVRYNKADRKMQENYQDQIFWLEMNDDLVRDVLKKRRMYQKEVSS